VLQILQNTSLVISRIPAYGDALGFRATGTHFHLNTKQNIIEKLLKSWRNWSKTEGDVVLFFFTWCEEDNLVCFMVVDEIWKFRLAFLSRALSGSPAVQC